MKNLNSKLQVPSSREFPSANRQKAAVATMIVAHFERTRGGFGTWDLELLWMLELGCWSFS
jgi:hypothetical protein